MSRATLSRLLPLCMVICAPLLDYFGHAVTTISAVLGLMVLAFYAFHQGFLATAINSSFSNKLFQNGTFLVALTVSLWWYSSYQGINPEGIKSWIQIPIIISLLTIFGMLAHRLPETDHIKVMSVLAWGVVALSLLALLERFVPSLSWTLHEDLRPSRLNFAARILLFGLPFALYQWSIRPQRIWMPLLVIVAIGSCNGRISWVVAPVIMAFYMVITFNSVGALRWAYLWLWSAVAFTLGVMALALSQGTDFLTKRVNDLNVKGGEGRSDIWSFALGQWEHHPLFGIGVQSFRYLDFSATNLKSSAHPHNSIVQLMLETGLIGTTVAFITLGYLCCRGWKNMAHMPRQRIAIFSCFLGVCGCSLASTSLFHGWWMVFMLTPLAWMLAWPKQNLPTSPTQ